MNDVIIVGILSLAGTLAGTIGGILTANKLTLYRIAELEKKVDKHNTIVERTYKLESDIRTAFIKIDGLKNNCHKEEG